MKRGDRYLLYNKLQDTGLQMSSSAQDPKLPKEQQLGRHEDSFPVKNRNEFSRIGTGQVKTKLGFHAQHYKSLFVVLD